MSTANDSNSAVFAQYARYYDLLYRDKDYAGEAAFVARLIDQPGGGRRLLELGCGTGRHAIELARHGWSVTGVDLSAGMVARAEARQKELPPELSSRLKFGQGDVRSVRLDEQFDAVISLFHVMCYQTTDEDLRAAIATAAKHLKPGGRFVFDFWHGPAVQADPPTVRVKRLEDAVLEVTRIAEPEIRPAQHCVVVNYDIFLQEKAGGAVSRVRESHPMRYLFLEEIQELLRAHGLTVVASGGWQTDRPLGPDTWYGWVAAERTPR